ncbi:hypothetical protein [Thermocatellispora tengchongensis]|uniref:hypothetical protein n=1 Tax=Thermocatellispora tengchongensis TaxID=1073253 RepID=UPI0036293C08
MSLSGCVFPTTPKGVRVGLRWPPLRWSSPRRVLADENDWRDWRERQDRRRTRDRQDKRDKRDKRDGRGTRDRRGRRERDLARAEEALSGVRPPAAPPPSAAEELAFLYRGLSKALDDAHTADDFAFGAMEVRRLTSLGAGRWLLAAYWLVCGYGLRMRRALGWSALIAAVAAGFVMVTSASHAVRAPARPSPSSVRTPEVLQGTSVPASPVLGDDYRDGSG